MGVVPTKKSRRDNIGQKYGLRIKSTPRRQVVYVFYCIVLYCIVLNICRAQFTK